MAEVGGGVRAWCCRCLGGRAELGHHCWNGGLRPLDRELCRPGELKRDGTNHRNGGWRRIGVRIVGVAQVDGLAGAGVDGAQVGLIQILRANDVGHDDEDDFVILNGVVFGTEDVLEDRDGAQTGDAGPVLLLLVVLDAAEDAGLAFAEANDLIDDALAEDGLGDSADGDGAALRGDFDLDFQRDIVVEVDGRRHLDIHADVLVLELGVDERTDDGCGCAGLIRAGGDGNPRTDLHGRLLVVGGADARALQHLGVRVGEQQVQAWPSRQSRRSWWP